MQIALPHLSDGARLLNVTSDAGTEAYAGWGGYGASKAALEQLTSVFAVEHPEYAVYSVDPGDMRTVMHQDAYPGEDISDRPLPEDGVAAPHRVPDRKRSAERALQGGRERRRPGHERRLVRTPERAPRRTRRPRRQG